MYINVQLTIFLGLCASALAARKDCKHHVSEWESTKVSFPTVRTIMQDMLKCGNMDRKTPGVFYSFGVPWAKVEEFADHVGAQPGGERPNTFEDALPRAWRLEVDKVVKRTVPAGLKGGTPLRRLADARVSQAMAELAGDRSYMLTPAGMDINQEPLEKGNVWRDQEMPTLKRDGKVITRVNADDFAEREVQQPGDFALVDSDKLPIPGFPAEDEGACVCPPRSTKRELEARTRRRAGTRGKGRQSHQKCDCNKSHTAEDHGKKGGKASGSKHGKAAKGHNKPKTVKKPARHHDKSPSRKSKPRRG